jgi:hypothetical protein
MLQITIPGRELWDEKKQEFTYTKDQTLSLEHSLVSISKWESKWHKPFIGKDAKTNEEVVDYIRCMTTTQNVDQEVYAFLTPNNIKIVNDYIEDKMTATWFNERKDIPPRTNSEQITSELIYYWMVALEIPFECQRWHLNRLLTLIRICNIKSKPAKKQSKREILSNNAALNAARREKLGTSG